MNKGKPSGKDAESKTGPGRKGDYKRSGWPEDAATQRFDEGSVGTNGDDPDSIEERQGRNRRAGGG